MSGSFIHHPHPIPPPPPPVKRNTVSRIKSVFAKVRNRSTQKSELIRQSLTAFVNDEIDQVLGFFETLEEKDR